MRVVHVPSLWFFSSFPIAQLLIISEVVLQNEEIFPTEDEDMKKLVVDTVKCQLQGRFIGGNEYLSDLELDGLII